MQKIIKSLFLAFIILICTVSISFATEETTDITDTISTANVEQQTIDTVKEIQTTKNIHAKKVIENDNNLRTTTSNDEYTYANTTLDITGNSFDGHEVTILDNVNVTSSNHIQLTGTAFNVQGSNVSITGLNISNWDANPVVIKVLGSNVTIKDNFINVTNTFPTETRAITTYFSNNVNITNNTIHLRAIPQAAGWDNSTGEWLEDMKVSGIKVQQSANVIVDGNNINITNYSTGANLSSVDAITIKEVGNSQVSNNIIKADGSDYVYGISLTRNSENMTVYNNTIRLIGQNYICGVQFSSTTNSTAKQNKVYGNCTATSGQTPSYEAFAYGIIDLTGTWGASTSEAVGNIIEENYVELNSTIAYAYELSNTDQTQILNNNATITGNVVMGLGIYNSTNSNITGNNFNITGNTRTLDSSIYEAVLPETTGIKLVGDTTNIRITQNVVRVSDNNNTTVYAVKLYCSGNVVRSNTLSGQGINNIFGDSAVFNGGNNEIKKNN